VFYLDTDVIIYSVERAEPYYAFRNLLLSTPFKLVPISRPILDQAAGLRAASGIKTPASIHAATALLANCTRFLTNDKGFSRVAGLSVQVLDNSLAK
jgi:predicted nucleic acid-binding protein